ncbi:MAG: DUF2281 domain-containing protein [Chloroflexi bacterium]|nr:DUF2281 domain-containing protein [Chloroflexota bacterium]
MTLLEEIKNRLNDLSPEKQGEVLDFIAFLQQREKSNPLSKSGKGERIKSALERVAELKLFKDILDPVEWQRQVRKDRPLVGRAS